MKDSPVNLTDHQYWMLDIAVEDPVDSVTLLQQESYTNSGEMRAPLNLAVEEIVDIAISLFQAGYISIEIDRQELEKIEEISRLKEKMINTSLSDEGQEVFRYELTTLGGETWENYSNPNWDYYITGYLNVRNYPNFYVGDLSCRSKTTLEKVLESRSMAPSLGLSRHRSHRPIAGTDVWTELGRWDATYWKTLDCGFKVEYKCDPIIDSIHIDDDKVMSSEELELYHFHHSLKEKWYTNYIDR